MNNRQTRNDIDPVRQRSSQGKAPADTRPLVVRLMEIEAIQPADRSVVQTEALDLWQAKIGDLAERRETVGHFIREGGPLDGVTHFLCECGLSKHSARIYDVVHEAIEAVGWPSADEICNPVGAKK